MTSQELKLLLDIEIKDPDSIQKFANNLKKALEGVTLDPKLEKSFKDLFTSLETSLDNVKKTSGNIVDQKSLNTFNNEIKRSINLFTQLVSTANGIKPEQWAAAIKVDSKETEEWANNIRQAQEAQANFVTENQNLKNALDAINQAYDEIVQKAIEVKQAADPKKEFTDAEKAELRKSVVEKYAKSLGALESALADPTNFDKINQAVGYIKRIGDVTQDTKEKIEKSSKGAKTDFDNLGESAKQNAQKMNEFILSQKDVSDSLSVLPSKAEAGQEALIRYANGAEQAARNSIQAGKNIDHLLSRLTYFLSIGNALRLLSRTIRSAFNTIKELDAAMTETATVTEYSVGQMWDKLDEYTNIANKLGATTLGTYKTITMFFQQGLNEQQALELATETMKMARVANIEYAEATQYMTAALRGFNLELNETQATRVNDVYSELAKITAADTEQIAIAMSKVASLANSANMELETTSAFLSQIIETTQEAPETAGTALKTIIARFSEVKKLFSEGELAGTDDEGEAVDVNKIGTALRTVGIDLNQFIQGNVGLDEIFMKLAQKWDELDLKTQRYIATQAAGSRQQSRFIAMMQDYDRTLELVNAAYNSAGSGQEQFDKTLESIEAKLNRLKNSWDSFTMSIANSKIVKGAVDLLNTLLVTINKLTDAFGSLSGVAKLFIAGSLAKIVGTLSLPALNAAQAAGGTMRNRWAAATTAFKESAAGLGYGFQGLFSPEAGLDAEKAALEQQLKSLEQKKDDKIITEEEYNKQLAITNSSLHQVKLAQEAEAVAIQKTNRNVQALGLSLVVVGNVVEKIGDHLEKNNKRGAELVKSLGSVITTTGSALVTVGTLGRTFKDTLGAEIKQLGAAKLTGIIAAFTLFIKLLEQASDAVTSLNNKLSEVNNQSIDINNAVQSLNTKQEVLDGMVKGTTDWYVQLASITEEYNNIVKKYPILASIMTLTENGIVYHEDQFKEITERLDKTRAALAAANVIKSVGFTRTVDGDFVGALTNDKSTLAGALKDTKYQKINIDELFEAFAGQSEQINEEINGLRRNKIFSQLENYGLEFTTKEKWFTPTDNLQSQLYFLKMAEALEDYYLQQLEEGNITQNSQYRDRIGQNKIASFGENEKQLGEQLDLYLESNDEAAAWKLYYEQFDSFNQVIKQVSDNELEAANLTKAFAMEVNSLAKDYEELTKVLKDNEDVLNSTEKNSQEYLLAISRITVAAQKVYGEGVSQSFIKANADKFYDAFVNGSEEAIKEINKLLYENLDIQGVVDKIRAESRLADDTIPLIDWDQNQEVLDDFKNALAELAEHDWTVEPTMDMSSWFTAMKDAFGWTQEEFEAVLKSMAVEGLFRDNGDGTFDVIVTNPSGAYGGNVRSSGKGGGGKKKNAWENPYDQLYNLTERNEEAIRRRNILEKEYNAILRDRLGSSTSLLKNSLQELANLQEQLAYQRRLQEGRIAQLNAVEGEMYTNSEGKRKSYADWGVTQYAHYNQQTNAIEIDWDAIDQVTDEEKGKAIEDYIKRLEELQKLYEQTQSDILDIEAAIDEINERGKKDYLTFEQRIYDAIVKQYQDQIDAYASLSDQIDEANQEILDQLNEQIELERQIRDNTKKEEEIADKEARLAYLQRDTSGANQTEILALQKEIEEARQSYQDDLIDQQIEQIQKGNEAASEQRQKQIELMQAQLDYWTEIGAFWSTVNELIEEGLSEDGTLKLGSKLVGLLEKTEGFIGMSTFGQMDWMDQLVKTFMQSMEGYSKFMMEQAENEGKIEQDGTTYTYDKDKKAWMMNGEAYSAVYDPVTGKYIFTRNPTNDVTTGTIGSSGNGGGGGSGGGSNNTGGGGKTKIYYIDYNGQRLDSYEDKDEKRMQEYLAHLVNNAKWSMDETKKKYDELQNRYYLYHDVSATEVDIAKRKYQYSLDDYKKWSSATIKYHYKTGGMADYTGPAWLDGTRTRPEAVLNADQTKLFISLRDILSDLKSRGGRLNELHGDTYVDLDVNANIGSDYDVDSLVARLKRDILDSSNYRNANVLSRGY